MGRSEGDEEDGVRHRNAEGHDGAHEGLQVQSGSGEEEHEDDSADDCRRCGDGDEGEAERLEVGGQQKIDGDNGAEQAKGKVTEGLAHGYDLSTDMDFDAAGW